MVNSHALRIVRGCADQNDPYFSFLFFSLMKKAVPSIHVLRFVVGIAVCLTVSLDLFTELMLSQFVTLLSCANFSRPKIFLKIVSL